MDLHCRKQESIDRIYTLVSDMSHDDHMMTLCLFLGRDSTIPLVCQTVQTKSIKMNIVVLNIFDFFQICPESADFMVEQYKKLRLRDTSGIHLITRGYPK